MTRDVGMRRKHEADLSNVGSGDHCRLNRKCCLCLVLKDVRDLTGKRDEEGQYRFIEHLRTTVKVDPQIKPALFVMFVSKQMTLERKKPTLSVLRSGKAGCKEVDLNHVFS